jgi:hypothetical protein
LKTTNNILKVILMTNSMIFVFHECTNHIANKAIRNLCQFIVAWIYFLISQNELTDNFEFSHLKGRFALERIWSRSYSDASIVCEKVLIRHFLQFAVIPRHTALQLKSKKIMIRLEVATIASYFSTKTYNFFKTISRF